MQLFQSLGRGDCRHRRTVRTGRGGHRIVICGRLLAPDRAFSVEFFEDDAVSEENEADCAYEQNYAHYLRGRERHARSSPVVAAQKLYEKAEYAVGYAVNFDIVLFELFPENHHDQEERKFKARFEELRRPHGQACAVARRILFGREAAFGEYNAEYAVGNAAVAAARKETAHAPEGVADDQPGNEERKIVKGVALGLGHEFVEGEDHEGHGTYDAAQPGYAADGYIPRLYGVEDGVEYKGRYPQHRKADDRKKYHAVGGVAPYLFDLYDGEKVDYISDQPEEDHQRIHRDVYSEKMKSRKAVYFQKLKNIKY